MRNLWVSRSNQPKVLSLSELFLSLSTGVLLILHHRFLGETVSSDHCNIKSVMAFVVLVQTLKCLILFVIFKEERMAVRKQRLLSKTNMMYPGLVKACTYLSFIVLVSGGRYLSTSIVVSCTLVFIFWLHLCSNDNQVAKTIRKGRNFSSNSIKISLLYLLTLTAIILQPHYLFAFQLHFQVFIIFSSSLLIFSYCYIHRISLMITNRDKTFRLLSWQSLFQVLALLVIWFYFFFMEQQMYLSDQLMFIKDNWFAVIILTVINTGYEMILWQHVRKVALSQLALTLTTGFLWLNIYLLKIDGMGSRLYISVILLTSVLLVNIGLLSKQNLKKVQKCLEENNKKGLVLKKKQTGEVLQDYQ